MPDDPQDERPLITQYPDGSKPAPADHGPQRQPASVPQIEAQRNALIHAECDLEMSRLDVENAALRAEVKRLLAELKQSKVDAKRRRTEACRLRKALKQFADQDNWVINTLALGDMWYWDGDEELPYKIASDVLRGDKSDE